MSGICGIAANSVEYGKWKMSKNYSGVGLAIVLININRYNGSLDVQSQIILSRVNLYINFLPIVLCVILAICFTACDLYKIYPKIQQVSAEILGTDISEEDTIKT